MQARITELLGSTDRFGIFNLIRAMDEGGFFKAPCSTAHHLCRVGGLAEHSLNVYDCMRRLNNTFGTGIPEDSLILVSILHDLGKMGDHGKQNYIENILASGKKSEAKPYVTNPALTYEEHEIRSVIIAERYIKLTEEEETAILHHNGLYGKLDSAFGNANYSKIPLAFLLHTADMYCSRFLEYEVE